MERDRRYELVGVPYTSMAEPGGIADAIAALRAAGLAAALSAPRVRDGGDLDLPEGEGRRGRSGLLNELALGRLVSETRDAVRRSHERGRLPLLAGGDCPVLLGALAGCRDRFGSSGLLLVDGHEDAWPPLLSPTGEASDSEVGIALGLFGSRLPQPLPELVPLLAPEALAILGPRDRGELEAGGVRSLAGSAGLFRDADQVVDDPAAAADVAVQALGSAASSFWLHLDLDVLSTAEFAAADYLQVGGLSWDDLLDVAGRALAASDCAGCSVAIYNPDLDPEGRAARRIVAFLEDLLGARAGVI